MHNKPLFTVGIVAYKNYRFIKEAIESVFIQDYDNIELIVSNDGSDDFREDELLSYFEQHRYNHPNIKYIKINNNERNLGTCKHLNKVKSMANGDYIMFMAADDAFYDKYSISNIVKGFFDCNEPLALCGRCGMYDNELCEFTEVVPRHEVVHRLQNMEPTQMYHTLVADMYIPTAATTYNMKAFKVLGDFDENIFLVEDWAFFLKMTRLGYKPGYIDVEVSKHRGGGGCHGNESGIEQFNKNFFKDEIAIMEIEIMPYLSTMEKSLSHQLKTRYDFLKALWIQKYEWQQMSRADKFQFMVKKSPKLLREGLNRLRHKLVDVFLTKFSDKNFILTIIFLFLVAKFFNLAEFISYDLNYYICYFAALFCTAAVGLFLTGICIRTLYFIYIPVKNGLKKILKR
ncbi:glycosyltransferase [Aminipila terrae]|uniref:Glycosyltransferase n=1 Tax=Aminipila terrae TaxID=2697030 RepID=A0A6P1MFV8_9FIRM|nr:glycosyltransferase [Aminipila terrae]QHI72063.1 glycosyltransferase [Aminipila terrae]